MKLSIIIPVLNEEDQIEKILAYLLEECSSEFTEEIIIVDGGSNDKTLEVLKLFPKVKVILSNKGRAVQMNEGVKHAKGEVLYFLHCDSFPPKNFDFEIIKEVENKSACGCFRMKFDENHPILKVSQWFTRFNFKSCRGGDQSLFVVKDKFNAIGGYNEELVIYEDNDLIFRLYDVYGFKVIQKDIVTSARRYIENGVCRLQFHFMVIHLMFRIKWFSNQRILVYYKRNIK